VLPQRSQVVGLSLLMAGTYPDLNSSGVLKAASAARCSCRAATCRLALAMVPSHLNARMRQDRLTS
jgi:hypothetical protein